MNKVSASLLLQRYGQDVEIIINNEFPHKKTKAFIQPLRQNDFKNLYGGYLDVSADNMGQYLYIGKPDVMIDIYPPGVIISCESIKYIMRSAQRIEALGKVLYIKAFLSRGHRIYSYKRNVSKSAV